MERQVEEPKKEMSDVRALIYINLTVGALCATVAFLRPPTLYFYALWEKYWQ